MKSTSQPFISLIKNLIYFCISLFIVLNLVAISHAYRFTHFNLDKSVRTKEPKNLSLNQKLKTLMLGVNIPKPSNGSLIPADYETIILQSNKKIECWLKTVPKSKGTVILFHGYSSVKITMLGKARIFSKLGYNTLLVDFMGSGASEGNQSTIGYKEAEQVFSAYEFVKKKFEGKTYLYGSSMGAVAIMKAVHEKEIKPTGIIIECPFGTMYETVKSRFRIMGIPSFPMAALLVFWGGTLNGFNAFNHKPIDYAKSIHCPTLLLYGAKDEKVSLKETKEIYHYLQGKKHLVVFENAGHENYLNKYESKWTKEIKNFIQ